MPMTSAELHNLNCYAYLSYLKQLNPDLFQELPEQYDPDYNYGKEYQHLLSQLKESAPDKRYSDLIFQLYANDNHILETTYQAIAKTVRVQTPGAKPLEGTIRKSWSSFGKKYLGVVSPYQAGGGYERLSSITSKNYKPIGLSTVRHYAWQAIASKTTEYRFPTQAQRHNGQERVNPLFEAFLQHDSFKPTDAQPITYVYFNFLRQDGRPKTFSQRLFQEHEKERRMTDFALSTLGTKYQHVAVITLPADDGLMDKTLFKKTRGERPYSEVFNELFLVACESKDSKVKIKDFFISPYVRELVFAKTSAQEERLTELLTEAFTDLGVQDSQNLSPSKQQAVWVHFVNYIIPREITEKLKPKGINFSCKDAIDRGGVASAWYNLMQSFKTTAPMNPDEFEQALHAAPAMVKGRGMNHHHDRIWNTVHQYVNAHHNILANSNEKRWLIHWRNMNCPKACLNAVFSDVLTQGKARLQHLTEDDIAVKYAKKLLGLLNIHQNHRKAAPWMVQLASQAVYLADLKVCQPKEITEQEVELFQALMSKIESPKKAIFIGLMKMLLGVITLSAQRISSGYQNVQLGFFSAQNRSAREATPVFTSTTDAKAKID